MCPREPLLAQELSRNRSGRPVSRPCYRLQLIIIHFLCTVTPRRLVPQRMFLRRPGRHSRLWRNFGLLVQREQPGSTRILAMVVLTFRKARNPCTRLRMPSMLPGLHIPCSPNMPYHHNLSNGRSADLARAWASPLVRLHRATLDDHASVASTQRTSPHVPYP